MDSFMADFYSQDEISEGEYVDADPRQATSEDVRETFNTPQQKSICGSNTSEKDTLKLNERLEQVEKELCENRSWRDHVEARLQALEKPKSVYPGMVIQKGVQEKEECEKLKEKIRELEARYQKLLSKAMSTHKQSENMNDPLRLSAVLDMYRMLKLQEWGKCWHSSARLSYPRARNIIQKLFDACERDIEKRKIGILQILGIPSLYYAANSCKQELMLDIVKLLRYGYYHNDSSICREITMNADLHLKITDQKEFALQCCRVFCLLLLQDSPVKAVWNLYECSLQHLEHVDQKDLKYCKKTELQILWPVLKDGEEVIEKGVVWDGN
ncbi:uncharacterized protein LOC110389835 isoform X2 [Numida meleagris]|uniref:uncharacterized protein LOC110389835 isoform X2 n=1 Tax=Numida meleagris TaxID=8996 RepID=UPI000B3D7F07|nr:uncharacterized protein LOC110389835 isoform X2 [Numida meleagris]